MHLIHHLFDVSNKWGHSSKLAPQLLITGIITAGESIITDMAWFWAVPRHKTCRSANNSVFTTTRSILTIFSGGHFVQCYTSLCFISAFPSARGVGQTSSTFLSRSTCFRWKKYKLSINSAYIQVTSVAVRSIAKLLHVLDQTLAEWSKITCCCITCEQTLQLCIDFAAS